MALEDTGFRRSVTRIPVRRVARGSALPSHRVGGNAAAGNQPLSRRRLCWCRVTQETALTGQIFISLLNPAIGLLFAAAFFLLWFQRRERYIAYAAAAYVATAFAFLVQDVAPALPMELQRLPANAGFLLTGLFFAAAIVGRYGLPKIGRAHV